MTAHQMERAPASAGLTSTSKPVLRRKCACGGTPGPTGECEQCRKKRLALQRQATSTGPAIAPPIVHDVLSSPGHPLDAATRAFMEPRFGHSFAGVRVHTDARAAESAAAVQAQAYTVGRDMVFASGRYAPASVDGRRLLAHELAHVIQQNGSAGGAFQARLEIGPVDDPLERQADAAADMVVSSSDPRSATIPGHSSSGAAVMLRRQAVAPASLDAGPVADMLALWKGLKSLRYGCFCGPGQCADGKAVSTLDSCCEDHDNAYKILKVTGETPKPGEVDMWSQEGFRRSRDADATLAGCAFLTGLDPRVGLEPVGQAVRTLVVALFSARAAYASTLR